MNADFEELWQEWAGGVAMGEHQGNCIEERFCKENLRDKSLVSNVLILFKTCICNHITAMKRSSCRSAALAKTVGPLPSPKVYLCSVARRSERDMLSGVISALWISSLAWFFIYFGIIAVQNKKLHVHLFTRAQKIWGNIAKTMDIHGQKMLSGLWTSLWDQRLLSSERPTELPSGNSTIQFFPSIVW